MKTGVRLAITGLVLVIFASCNLLSFYAGYLEGTELLTAQVEAPAELDPLPTEDLDVMEATAEITTF